MTNQSAQLQITIDARFLSARLTGLGRYVGRLVAALQEIDAENRYTVLLRSSNWDEYHPARPNFERRKADVPWYTVSEQLRMPPILARTKPNLVHFPNFNVPLIYRGPFVVTIHDLIKSEFGAAQAATGQSRVGSLKYLVYKQTVQSAARRARLILVPSAAVRSKVEEMLGIVRDKIIITPEAADPVFHEAADALAERAVLARYGVRQPYLLYVGNAYPYKNLGSVIDALSQLPEPLCLVNPCARDAFYPSLRQRASERGVEHRVILPGFVPDEDLAVLYRRAEAYVFPSLSEGFGIPALEAMASGLPVACSDIPVLREVCAEAATYFSPQDPASIAEAVLRLTSNADFRRELVAAGRERAAAFTWRRTAELTRDAYLTAAAARSAAPR